MYLPQLITQTGHVANYDARTFQLSDLPQVNTFKDLYDSYRISSVQVRWVPKFQTNFMMTELGSDYMTPEIMSVIDHDDANVFTINDMLQSPTFRRTRAGREHKRYLKVCPLKMMYESSTGTAYGQNWKEKWIDCDDSTVPHYGLKTYFTPFTTNIEDVSTLNYDLYVTYYVQFRQVI